MAGIKKILFIFVICAVFIVFVVLKLKNTIDKANDKLPISQIIATSTVAIPEIKQFTSLAEMQSFLQERGQATGRGGAMIKTMESSAAAPAIADGLGGGSDYSQTNVQVQGIDEADIVKTDGNSIFFLSRNSLFIIDAASPEKMNVLARLDFNQAPADFYLIGKKLAVFGNDYQFGPLMATKIAPMNSGSFLKIYDISDLKAPKLSRDLFFEGNYFSSRLKDNRLYFVLNVNNFDPILRTTTPVIYEAGKELASFSPRLYYFDRPYNNWSFTSVYSLDLSADDAALAGNVYLTDAASGVYMSENNIYLSLVEYKNSMEPELQAYKQVVYPLFATKEREMVDKINNAEDYLLSPDEKLYKVKRIYDAYIATLSLAEQKVLTSDLEKVQRNLYLEFAKNYEYTKIYKINLELQNVAAGSVPGRFLNQFSFDEHDNNLRVATTRDQFWTKFSDLEFKSTNHVYVLNDKLQPLGALENLSEGEQIYAARFMGDKVYLVTYERVDPLLAIGLSDPTSPKLLGALKIPGYSSYLHPYDENTLIGIGIDTKDNNGRMEMGALKIAVFDVRDPGQPLLLSEYLAGGRYSYSEALNNHKAILFSKDKEILALPVYLTDDKNADYAKGFAGSLILKTNDRNLKLLGKISHSADAADTYNRDIRRNVYIGNMLYTLSDGMVQSHALSDLKLIGSLKLEQPASPILPLSDAAVSR